MQSTGKSRYIANGELLSGDRIEELLQKKGFKPKEKIIINSSCLYIKCLTKSGHSVFVELDTGGIVAKTGCDFAYIKSDKAELVPYAYRMGCFKTAGSHVAGVAFQCEDGICTLTSIDEPYPKMVNFVTRENCNIKVRTAFISEQGPHAYPIVRLSEILVDSELVHSMIAESSDNIMRVSYALSHTKLIKLSQKISNLGDSLTHFMMVKDEKMKELCDSIKKLESVAENNSSCDAKILCDDDKAKDAQITANLAKRRKLFTNLIRSSNCIISSGPQISKICEGISEMSKCMEKEYLNLDKVFRV